MFFNLVYFVFFPIFFSNLHIFEGFFQPIEVEKNITLDYYTGKWFQAATSRSTRLFGTGINYTSVTAEYQCIDNCKNNNISVLNQGIDPKGNYNDISGYSYVDNISEPSKRKLKFYSLPFIGNYWITKLGPIINDQYQYSIISGPISTHFGTRFSLYVLCRDVENFKKNYETEVKEWCLNNGFNQYWNEYISTY